MSTPQDPPIYHITHVDNLAGILAEGGLWCDSERISRALATTNIAHEHIKSRRRTRVVRVAAGGVLSDYVPFNFCPRSVMLYAVNRGHDDYSGGQESIVHLVSSFSRATALGSPWAFTDRHAEVAHALHFDDPAELDEVPWNVMPEHYWSAVKEERQAEFLVHRFFPLTALLEVGTYSEATATRVRDLLLTHQHALQVTVRPDWYY